MSTCYLYWYVIHVCYNLYLVLVMWKEGHIPRLHLALIIHEYMLYPPDDEKTDVAVHSYKYDYRTGTTSVQFH